MSEGQISVTVFDDGQLVEQGEISIQSNELRALRNEARERQISVIEVVSHILGKHLVERAEPPLLSDEDYLSIVGLGASGLTDVSAEHDRYLGEAIADEHLR